MICDLSEAVDFKVRSIPNGRFLYLKPLLMELYVVARRISFGEGLLEVGCTPNLVSDEWLQ